MTLSHSATRRVVIAGVASASAVALQGPPALAGPATGGEPGEHWTPRGGLFAAQDLEVLLRWVADLVAQRSLPPMHAARLYDAALRAAFDAAGPAVGLRPLLADVDGSAGRTAAGRWAAAVAVGTVAGTTVDDFAAGAPPRAAWVDAFAELGELGGSPRDAARRRRAQERWGRTVASAVLIDLAADGAVAAHRRAASYTWPGGPGHWVPTPPALARPLEPSWGTVRTRTLRSAGLPEVMAPPARSGDGPGTVLDQGRAVLDQAARNTLLDVATAAYWADGAGTPTPAGHWIQVVLACAVAEGLDGRRALLLARDLGGAVHDAFVVTWHHKYVTDLARPVTVIRERLDPEFTPLLLTPAFPEHPSGHSTVSAAVAEVAEAHLGAVALVDTASSAPGAAPRRYARAWDAAREASYSRLCGGIHYPSGCAAGLDLGLRLGRHVVRAGGRSA